MAHLCAPAFGLGLTFLVEARVGEFVGQKVIVTGAAGIHGKWIAAAFARAGATLCLSDLRADKLAPLPAELELDPAVTLTHATDLREASSIAELAGLVERAWGAPDVLINVAGLYPRTGVLHDLDPDVFDTIMAVNVRAPFLTVRAFTKQMIAKGVKGRIVNIGSGAARQMVTGSVTYCTSKAALERLSKGQALELAPFGIRVNVVEPGFAAGSEVSTLPADYVARMEAKIPLGRSSGPDDASAAVMFLCSTRSAFVTGAVVAVDGGNSIGTYQPATPSG
ncbi:MAG: SDR family oxidoreductase [Rhodospirillales bacterium]|nr:SDR family oxidoreductase [Rhodospirillales bacterium]